MKLIDLHVRHQSVAEGFPPPDFPERFVDVRPWRSGRFSWVYAARDALLGRAVALKRLRPLDQAFAEAEARMRREASTLARLDHPAIVRVFDVQTSPHLILVEELIEGQDLASLLSDLGRLAAPRVAAIGAVIADALAHAHSKGVLHRDIHPSDILLSRDGAPHLLDFGYARWKDVAAQTLGGPVLARLDYASPEVVRGQPGDEAADTFSLGVLLYELVTGVLPHPRARPFQRPATPVPPSQLLEVPEELERWIMAMLSSAPEARPDLSELAARLAALAQKAPPPLAKVAEYLGVVRQSAHPLKNRLGLVKRYPDDPDKVRQMLRRDSVRSETLELVRRALAGFRACLGSLPGDWNPPSLAPLSDLEAALAGPIDADPLPALATGYEAVRALVDLGVRLGRRHMFSAAQWAEDWAAASDEPLVRQLAPATRRFHLWTESSEPLAADLTEVAATLLANAAEAGATTLTLALSADDDQVQLRFTDDGSGLPPGDPDRLFAAGESHKEHGSGFGLADARERLVRRGGGLTAAPAEGGACFTLRLPLRPWELPEGDLP